MMTTREGRMKELIGRLTAEFFAKNSNRTSLITITNTLLSSDLKRATILITVLPEREEEKALEFAKRKRSEVREYLHDHGRFSILPMVDIEIDKGEKSRQRIDELSRNGK